VQVFRNKLAASGFRNWLRRTKLKLGAAVSVFQMHVAMHSFFPQDWI
jgi:hypothetical protein